MSHYDAMGFRFRVGYQPRIGFFDVGKLRLGITEIPWMSLYPPNDLSVCLEDSLLVC